MDKKTLKKLLKEFNSLAENVDRIRILLEKNLEDEGSSNIGESSTNRDEKSSQGTSVADILDLSGELKKVQLTVLKLGTASLAELAGAFGLPEEELLIYLKTLVRQGLLEVTEGKYRAILRKRGAKSFTLFDKLDRG